MIRNAVRVAVVALAGAGLLAVATPAQADDRCVLWYGHTYCLLRNSHIS